MRRLFCCLAAIAVFTALASSGLSAQPLPSKPKSPGEIAIVSRAIVHRNEDCRRQARELHLHLLKRLRFMHACKSNPPG